MLKRNANWAAEARPIQAYFVQDYVSPSEGPMAAEVSRREFADWAVANMDAPIEYDEMMKALYLRLDVQTANGLAAIAPAL